MHVDRLWIEKQGYIILPCSVYITTTNLSEDILSFTRMFVSLNGNMEKKETLYLPMIEDNDFMWVFFFFY